MTDSPTRIDPVTVANAAENARLASIAPVSPTGTPLVPAQAVPYLMAFSAVMGVPAALAGAGIAVPAVVVTICSALGMLALVLLGGSPGLRKLP